VSVKDFGAVGDGVTDDTAAIQAAIDATSLAGGGEVTFTEGSYLATALQLKSYVSLRGVGAGSELKQVGSTSSDFITLSDVDQIATKIVSIAINGNSDNQSTENKLVSFDNSGGTVTLRGDHYHELERVFMQNAASNAIYINVSRECKLSHVLINDSGTLGTTDANKAAVYIAGTDCTYTDVTTGFSLGHGFFVAGQNNKFLGCKAFDAGQGGGGGGGGAYDGFFVSGSRNTFSSCEAQDNGRDGFRIFNGSGVKHVVLSACIADANNESGFRITETCSYVSGSSLIAFTRPGSPQYTQDNGIFINASAFNCNFTGAFEGASFNVLNQATNVPVLQSDEYQSIHSITFDADFNLNNRVVISDGVDLTNAINNNLVEVTLPSNSQAGGSIEWSVEAADGTDFQSISNITHWAATNKAGVKTATVATDATNEAKNLSAGTLTATINMITSGSGMKLVVNPNSSLTTTSYKAFFKLTNNSDQGVTLL
jgi:hypothetical protein